MTTSAFPHDPVRPPAARVDTVATLARLVAAWKEAERLILLSRENVLLSVLNRESVAKQRKASDRR